MKNDYFQDEKLKYEEIEVPDELLFVVRRTIEADRKKKADLRRRHIVKTAVSATAVGFLCLTIGVNSSYAFAEAAVKIPVVKSMAQAVVIRSYKPEIVAVYEEHKTGRHAEKEPEAIPEKQPEALLAENNENDGLLTLSGAAGSEASEEMPVEMPEGLDVWKAEMTPEKLREVTELYVPELEKKYADTPEKLRTILLAELPEKDISLYGYHENGRVTGTALRVGNEHRYFDWNYMDENARLPEISCKDTDGDGTEEILVFLYNGAIPKNEADKDVLAEETTDTAEAVNVTNEADTAEVTNAADAANAVDYANPSEAASGNDVTQTPEQTDNKQKPEPEQGRQAGELWVIFPAGEVWPASLRSTL